MNNELEEKNEEKMWRDRRFLARWMYMTYVLTILVLVICGVGFICDSLMGVEYTFASWFTASVIVVNFFVLAGLMSTSRWVLEWIKEHDPETWEKYDK